MLAEECEGNKTPDLAMIGFRALVNTLSSESYKTEEVITSFQPEDFATDAANEKYAELAMQIGQVRENLEEHCYQEEYSREQLPRVMQDGSYVEHKIHI